jgi:hypothetical protein
MSSLTLTVFALVALVVTALAVPTVRPAAVAVRVRRRR